MSPHGNVWVDERPPKWWAGQGRLNMRIHNILDCEIGYTVTAENGHTRLALSPEEMAEDFPDMRDECMKAVDNLYWHRSTQESIVRAHFKLPLTVV